MRKSLICLSFLISLTACSQRTPQAATDSFSEPVQAKMAASAAQPEGMDKAMPTPQVEPIRPIDPARVTDKVQQMIIRNANIRFRVDDFKASGKNIEATIKQLGGLLMSSNETKSYGNIENNLTIRVPAVRFDTLVNTLLKESIFTDSKNITAEDVTADFIDTEARMKAKKAVEQRYIDLLKQARNVEEIIKVEEQLRVIREEAEVQEGHLKYLKDQVSYSTINLAYYQVTDVATSPEAPFYKKIWDNFTEGSQSLLTVFYSLFFFIPFLPIVYGVYWLVRRWRRNRKAQSKPAAES